MNFEIVDPKQPRSPRKLGANTSPPIKKEPNSPLKKKTTVVADSDSFESDIVEFEEYEIDFKPSYKKIDQNVQKEDDKLRKNCEFKQAIESRYSSTLSKKKLQVDSKEQKKRKSEIDISQIIQRGQALVTDRQGNEIVYDMSIDDKSRITKN